MWAKINVFTLNRNIGLVCNPNEYSLHHFQTEREHRNWKHTKIIVITTCTHPKRNRINKIFAILFIWCSWYLRIEWKWWRGQHRECKSTNKRDTERKRIPTLAKMCKAATVRLCERKEGWVWMNKETNISAEIIEKESWSRDPSHNECAFFHKT